MQLGSALTFPLRDARWFRKLLGPALLLIIPFLGGIVAAGWALEICRKVIRKDPDCLPDMNFRKNAADGLRTWIIFLAYGIPVYLFLCAGSLIVFPLFVSEKDVSPASVLALMCGIEFLILVIAFLAAVFASAAAGNFAARGSLGAAFHFREVFCLVRSAPQAYLLLAPIYLLLTILASLGALVCFIGLFFTTAYAAAVGFSLMGQAYALAGSRRDPSESAMPM
jgi:Protein of unknown function (DUF4013)